MPAKKKTKVALELELDISMLEKSISEAFKYMSEGIQDYIHEDFNDAVGKAVAKTVEGPVVKSEIERMVEAAVKRIIK